MSEEVTETVTETGAGAATGAAATAAAGTKPPEGAAATATTETTQTSGEPDPKERARQAFVQRDQKREKRASEELAATRRELDALKAQLKEKPKPEAEPTSFLDDPEKALKEARAGATRDAVEAIKQEQAQAEAKRAYHQTTEKAAEFLLTRSHLKEDKALREEVLKVVEEKYAHLAAEDGARDPRAAARLAYIDVCAAKGITPDMDGFKATGFDATRGANTTGVKPTGAGGDKRTWTKREAEKYLMDSVKNPATYKARSAEMDEAKREGRIK